MTTVALAGNPNSGKTTLFNGLTGARQHVGNYPGVTVEHKRGTYNHDGISVEVEDLPGIYSLSAYSAEEEVARDFLIRQTPDVVIDIVDSSNLERNLYLSVQLKEMGLPVCLALNMMDVAESRGMEIDTDKLSSLMRTPVVPIVARKSEGIHEMMNRALEIAGKDPEPFKISYGPDIDPVLDEMARAIDQDPILDEAIRPRWSALKYLEGDETIKISIAERAPELEKKLNGMAETLDSHLRATLDTYAEALIADHRYGYIKSILQQGVLIYRKDREAKSVSDRIDAIVTHRFVGPIVMLAVLGTLYHITFAYSEIPVGWFESFFGWIGSLANDYMSEGPLKSMVMSGVIDGVGGVMGFVPLIFLMFLGISFLEDTGYLARVAFMLDRVFRVFGLHGSSVMPFIISGGIAGGCAVPGVMAARTIKSPKERLATLLTVPFMNCGAKLPVFALLIGVFFPEGETRMMLLITAISWIGAMLAARLLRSTILRGETTPFVMELPTYRFPTFRGLLIHTWERTWQYIKKAGTVILGISILLWAMMTYPGLDEKATVKFENMREKVSDELSQEKRTKILSEIDGMEAQEALRRSYAGRIGTALEKVTSWAGFDWRDNIALVGGFAAKEVVVSTLGTAYSLGEVDPEESGGLASIIERSPDWSPLKALALIIFTMFYAPCFVTVVCIAKEAGSWKWAAFSMTFNTLLAYLLAVAVYQGGAFIQSIGG
ncbi:ferrous iron transport protein B [Dethiosulfovibrio sp. F2B]|uniref:ferrous iron transport protein B n=1 Tax=Dethiosulfovibrio faecalis TaxID=2720018 RepID=UPI001F2E0B46|nr:ferrous iron transport protein B [Dethiosulfovibrio faecalis]MCF4152136.1 ferrous iron transport protein B [Dethiosulfovibrio faecalis]